MRFAQCFSWPCFRCDVKMYIYHTDSDTELDICGYAYVLAERFVNISRVIIIIIILAQHYSERILSMRFRN